MAFPHALVMGHANFQAESVALFARMTSGPSDTRKRQIDTLIRTLKGQGIWATLDGFWIPAAGNSQDATLNWVSSSFTLIPNGGITFTADRGYTGNGTSGSIDTGLTVGGGNATQNSHAAGVYMNVDPNFSGFQMSGSALEIGAKASPGPQYEALSSSGGGQFVAVTNGLGYSGLTRTASTGFTMQKDLAQTAKTAAASGFSGGITLMQGGGSGFSSGRIAMAHLGGGLTTAQLQSLDTALVGYLTAIGAN